MNTEIYRENDYSKFKKLDGNRGISPNRVRKIVDSINDVGYILNPICVNERMEIIDGQGRFEALKLLSLPIDYYIVPGIGINECIAMNVNMTNWKLEDYVYCYADLGNQSYLFLKDLYDKYKHIGIHVILNACKVKYLGKLITAEVGNGGSEPQKVKFGTFQCSEEEYKNAIGTLDFINSVYSRIHEINAGRKDYYYLAMAFAYRNHNCDNRKLADKFNNEIKIKPVTSVPDALEELERIYNYKLSKDAKVYLVHDYQVFCDNRG